MDRSYMYSDDLAMLDSFRQCDPPVIISEEVCCPLEWSSWADALADHPDSGFVDYILTGIRTGFRIGFNRSQDLEQATGNMYCHDPSLVSNYLSRELLLHRMWKLPAGVFPRGIQISPIGLIPKKNRPGKWRMIVDLSSPPQHSVNEGISEELSSLAYTCVDHLAALILSEGRGSSLVKADIKEAYRMVPIHPEDQHLLGIQWNDSVYVDRMLPFGLRSAPKIFSAIADAAQWVLKNMGVTLSLHYLDDFILVAKSTAEATQQKHLLVSQFERLGIPLEPAKLEGPTTCLTFLGIEVDTVALQLRLPGPKLSEVRRCLRQCAFHPSISKHTLEHLTGLLQFATKVVRPGRPFLRRLYALQNVGDHPDHRVRMSAPAQADIVWWLVFSEQWNGISLLWDLKALKADLSVLSDALGSWGCGAIVGHQWLQLKWPPPYVTSL